MAAGVPETRFNVPVGPHKMFDGTTVALADVAEIRRKVPGATVNDVVIATVGGALRKYLAKHKELPKESLVAVAPINLRGKEKGAGPGGKGASTPGNQVSAMSVPEIGRAHVWTPVTNAHLVCRLLLEKKKKISKRSNIQEQQC